MNWNRRDVVAGVRAALDKTDRPDLTTEILRRIDAVSDADLSLDAVVEIAKAVWSEEVERARSELRDARRDLEFARVLAEFTCKTLH